MAFHAHSPPREHGHVQKHGIGLRLQIVLALGGVLLIAFVPLFFAIAALTQSAVSAPRESVRSDPDAVAIAESLSADSMHYAHTVRSTRALHAIALYMGIFALALLVFAYMLLTRVIVRPVETLARAASRVADGAASFELPSAGASEIGELGASVRAMAARFDADEAALRTKVNELTALTEHLRQTRAQLEGSERLASIGRLASGIAHEIGNPLTAIMGMHDVLESPDIPKELHHDFLQRMRKETERIHAILHDLLEFSRPEHLEMGGPASSSHLAIANLLDAASYAVALVQAQRQWRDIPVTVAIDAAIDVRISTQRLTQVLLNLLLNAGAAIQSVAPSSSTLGTHALAHESRNENAPCHKDADRTQHAITVRAERLTPARVSLCVEDTGPGVAPHVRATLFEPFVTTKNTIRSASSRETGNSGTGLGLAVCRGIVEGAAGTIRLDETYMHGARFVVELPACSGPLETIE